VPRSRRWRVTPRLPGSPTLLARASETPTRAPKLQSVKETAAYANISEQTVRRPIKAGS